MNFTEGVLKGGVPWVRRVAQIVGQRQGLNRLDGVAVVRSGRDYRDLRCGFMWLRFGIGAY
ncbi:MAG: hypothetical protein ACREP7_22295 [Lysobacter sp.]